MTRLHDHLKRISNALFKQDIDDCELVSKAYELLRDIYKEVDGNPSIILMDGKNYKVIPTELADKICEEV